MLNVSESNGVFELTLNRPDVRNAFDASLIQELRRNAQALQKRNDIHLVVLRGEGKSFCAGADLNWMSSMADSDFESNYQDSLDLFDLFLDFYNLPMPLISIAHGAALGGGMGLLCVSDLVAAAPDTKFGFTEVRLGLIPSVISAFCSQRLNLGHMHELFVSGRVFQTDHAIKIGLVHYEFADVKEGGRALTEELLSRGPVAMRESKALSRSYAISPEGKRCELAKLIARIRVSPEGQEGMRAMLEKRPAVFGASK